MPAPTVSATPNAMTTAPDGCMTFTKVIKIPIGINSIAEIKKAVVVMVG